MPRHRPPTRVRRVRYTDAQWALIRAAAERADEYPSTWLRIVSVRVAREQLAEAHAGAD